MKCPVCKRKVVNKIVNIDGFLLCARCRNEHEDYLKKSNKWDEVHGL